MNQHSFHWVGIDLHQKTLTLAVYRGQEREPLLTKTLPGPNFTRLRRILRQLDAQAPVRVVYEASGCGYVLARLLEAWGFECDVAAPSLIPRRPGDRVKTDKRDALKLATMHRGGLLTPVHIPSEAEERLRTLVRTAEAARKDVRRSKQRILKLLQARGLTYRGKNWTLAFWRWLRGLRLEGLDQISLNHHLAQLETGQGFAASLQDEVEARSVQKPYGDPVARLRCLRGIDTLSAMTLATETIDMRRFASPRKYMGWVGLGVSEFTSVNRVQGGITRTGSGRCRRILVEAAWNNSHRPHISKVLEARMASQPPAIQAHAWRAQQRLHRTWRRLEPRIGSKRAAVAMARQLAGFVWALWLARPEYLSTNAS